jgi:protein TonB
MARFTLALALAVLSIEATGQTSTEAKRILSDCDAKPTTTTDCACVRPQYPAKSRRKLEEGEVRVRVKVLASGTVENVQIERSSGYPRLDQASVVAAKQSCYHPARNIHGKPIDGFATVLYVWKFNGPVH